MSRLEERYKRINDIYDQFSYSIIAYDACTIDKLALLRTIKELKHEIEMLECDLLK